MKPMDPVFFFLFRTPPKQKQVSDKNAAFRRMKETTHFGTGDRALLRKGDVLCLHQRVATTISINRQKTPALMLQFRIMHVDMDNIAADFSRCEHAFTGFEGLQAFLG